MNEAKEIPATSAEQIIASRQLELNQARQRIAELEAELKTFREVEMRETEAYQKRITQLEATIEVLAAEARESLDKLGY